MKILILNGPNLNLLGQREETHYGNLSLDKIKDLINNKYPDLSFTFFQSNHEGEIIEKIQNSENEFDGLIINPGGYAHSSVAIHDALNEIKIPKIEVHLSHLANREEFRQSLITAKACNGYISGFKEYSYLAGIFLLNEIIIRGKN